VDRTKVTTGEYDATDEFGFARDDPDAAIPWPTLDPILSECGNQNDLYCRVAAPAQRS
jgi:dTDP-4-dehydrorhamnose 3,5-epimerase-like enzyme